MSRKLIALLSALSLVLSFSILPVAADHNTSNDQDPQLVLGNPSCATLYGSDFLFEVKIEPVADGTYPYAFDGFSGTIILDVNEGAKTFDYEITGNAAAVGVIVKGGPNANWYDYSPGSETSDQDLHAPSRNGGLFGLSHISFCMVEGTKDPSVATTSSQTGTILPGTSVTDTATVTGVTDGPVPTGDVTFFLCQPATVTTNGGDCSAGGDQVGVDKTLGASDGMNPPSASATSDASTTTTTEGKYCWRAEYEGDTVYNAASHTNSTTECFTVAKNTPGLTTDPWVFPNDSATFSGLAGTDDDDFGTVQFFLYQDDNTCAAGTHVFASGLITVEGDETFSTDNTTFAIDSDNEDTYYWQAVYSGDENNSTVTTACTAEQFDIDFTVTP